jgi:uncharacterized protein
MSKCGKCPICKIVGLLLVVGAINWGLVGVFNINIVTKLLGGFPIAETVVYGLIGVAGILGLISCFKQCPCTKDKS